MCKDQLVYYFNSIGESIFIARNFQEMKYMIITDKKQIEMLIHLYLLSYHSKEELFKTLEGMVEVFKWEDFDI